MPLIVKDRVRETTATTGTADFTLGGAAAGFQTFAVIGNTNTTYYAAVDQANSTWEVGIGTYSSTGPTLTRDTVFESSNAGSKVNFAAGPKDVFCTYPAERSVYLDAAGSAVTVLDIGTLGTSTANITTANITAGTVSTTPASGNDLVNKTYVDTAVSSGIHFHQPVRVESPINLTATYNNGTAGVGATLTNSGTQVALVIDGVTVSVADRVLVYQQTTQTQNGIYVVTNVGSGSTNWILTRSSDANTYAAASATALGEGSAVFVQQGSTGAGETYVCNTPGTITFGTTNITFAQVSSAQIYSAGTGLTLSGTQFSITNTGTAGTYGSASNVPVFVTNAQGQVTSVTNTAIAITSAAVSGLAASATTDTTNAANITSGTLPSARLSGSYTGITGVGTLTAGTWNASTIAAIYGGTGQTSYVQGDLLYATSSTAVGRLADVVAGNALISGGVGGDPAWGKIGLSTHVDGTLPVANGGTGNTTAQAEMNRVAGAVTSGQYLRGNGTNVVMSAIQVADVPTLNQNTTGTAANVTGTVAIANGGTGQTTAAAAITALTGTQTSGQYLRSNGTNAALSAIQVADVPTLNQNTTGTAANVTGTVAIANGGSGTTTAQGAMNAFAGAVTSGSYLRGNGTNVVMSAIQVADVPTLNQNTTGTAANVTGTVAVANGGTGTTTLTANNVVLGNGASAVQFVAPGTSGNVLTSNGTTWTSGAAPGFPSGTVMMFVQTTAPTGWTKSTTHDNKALRVVSGTVGSGGTVAFTTAFASQAVSGTVNNHTLTEAQMPSHTHTYTASLAAGGRFTASGCQGANGNYGLTTGATGGGGAHSHGFSGTAINLAVQYVDVIIATRN